MARFSTSMATATNAAPASNPEPSVRTQSIGAMSSVFAAIKPTPFHKKLLYRQLLFSYPAFSYLPKRTLANRKCFPTLLAVQVRVEDGARNKNSREQVGQ